MQSVFWNSNKFGQLSCSFKTSRTHNGNSSFSQTAGSFRQPRSRCTMSSRTCHSARGSTEKRKKEKKRNHTKPRKQEYPQNQKVAMQSWTEQWCSSLDPTNVHASEISLTSDFKVSYSRSEKGAGVKHSENPKSLLSHEFYCTGSRDTAGDRFFSGRTGNQSSKTSHLYCR